MKKLLILLPLIISGPSWAQVVNPPHQTVTPAVMPVISASFPDRVKKARIWVDGTEFTTYVQTRDNVVYLNPPYALDYGTHHVRVETDRQQVAWNFSIVNPNERYGPRYPNRGQGYYNPGNSNQGYYHQNHQNSQRKRIQYDNRNTNQKNDHRRRDRD